MARGAVIIRELTDSAADLRPARDFTNRELPLWGFRNAPPVTLEKYRMVMGYGGRIAVVIDDSVLVATVTVFPQRTDEGFVYDVPVWLIRYDHPDKLLVLDSLALWACNRLRSEGVEWVTSTRDMGWTYTWYGRDHLGMKGETWGTNVKTGNPSGYVQRGRTDEIIETILERRPEWAQSLSSMTLT